MKEFFTRTGDDGYTGLLGKDRVPKYHPRTNTLGDLDEAATALGLARANLLDPKMKNILLQIQRDLYHIMAEVSATPDNANRFREISSGHVIKLENQTNEFSQKVDIPSDFIIPGDSPGSALLAFSRSVVRRAERSVVKLFHNGELENLEIIRYLNRLSSLLFVLELVENFNAGIQKTTLAKE